ncbi:MAG: LysM peptidoglycan-binding domain-containing protein [Ardenticatenia bacterium]|nr:LysM peptidoglycan-binding domain-containing protein [Ardenticatenia bacterium]
MKTACRILAGLGALLALTAAAPSARAQMAAPQGEWGTHVVHAGESLFDVASRYRMATQDLARLNGRALGDILWPGQALWIPVANVRSARAGQTARAASNRRGTKPPAPLRSASAGVRPYTVQPGDTLSTIAASLGTDVDSLIRLNGLPLDGSIQAGATLIVEGQAKDDAAAEPLPTRAAGPAPSGATTAAYTVQAGDTLSTIATRFGESATALQRLNGLADDAIYEGQTLLIPAQGQGPTTALGGAKRIVVDVSEQRMYVWQGDALVWNFVASTGLAGYPTQRGSFQVQSKIPNAWSSAWQLWMPYWLGIYWAGGSENGIHALPIINGQTLWEGYLGSPISYGCVVLSAADAERLYNWAEAGTAVDVRD